MSESAPIHINGFTDAALRWSPWLPTVDPQQASPAQLEVLDESGANARQSPYYLTLVHQPDVLRQRSRTYNAIMYAPGGLPRAERELAATAVSRVNGCVYCGSVHARRFEQLARREDAIVQVFEDPHGAGTTARERAIVRFAIELTLAPGQLGAEQLRPLREAGLDDLEILDLIHSVAIFAWANRLMLNLGEPLAAAG